MNEPLTTNIHIRGSWQDVLDNCRWTVHKNGLGKEPSDNFKKTILIAEHSPIRCITICWDWKEIPYWVMNEFARHKWEKFVTTSREDRTGVPRSERKQTDIVSMRCEANIQALIDTARKRLCNQAAKETVRYMSDLKYELHKVEPLIADVLVPNCVYRMGCPELKSCNRPLDLRFDIQGRYNSYNQSFYESFK